MTAHYSRVVLQPTSDTGVGLNGTDTGPSCFGELVQLAWQPSDIDTGGDLVLFLTDVGSAGDTGDDITVFNDNDCLGTSFIISPRLKTTSSEGMDTGTDSTNPIVFAGERPKVKFLAGQAEAAGKIYLWFKH